MMMKGTSRASLFLRQAVSAIMSVVKAKSMAVKNKTDAVKTRLMILSVLRSKRAVLSSFTSCKTQHAPSGHVINEGARDEEACLMAPVQDGEHEEIHYGEAGEDDDKGDEHPDDLGHSLFNEDDDGLEGCTGSVIDLVRSNGEGGTEFKLEDEIDHVADVFIRRFHKQMRLQRQQSFKRYQEMLERSV